MIEDELGPQSVADDIRRVSRQGQCRERSIFARLDRHRHHSIGLGAFVWLHPECRRYWLKKHPQLGLRNASAK